jgi:hypothetical protein
MHRELKRPVGIEACWYREACAQRMRLTSCHHVRSSLSVMAKRSGFCLHWVKADLLGDCLHAQPGNVVIPAHMVA